jgi:hypothetical protein
MPYYAADMKLSASAKANDLMSQTAWGRWRGGKLPVPAGAYGRRAAKKRAAARHTGA